MKFKEKSEKAGLKLNIQKTKIMVSGHITSKQIDGETGTDFIFLGSKITADGDCSHEIKRRLLLRRKAMANQNSILKSRDITLPTKVSQSYGFSGSHVWMWELDYKEGWVSKNWCFWTVVLEKTLESPLGCKIKPVNPKENQLRIFIGRTDANLKLQYFGYLMQRSDSLEKNPDAGKYWRQEEKGTTEDEMVGWHHQLSELLEVPGDGEGQGGLVYCSPWGRKKSDTTEWLNKDNKVLDKGGSQMKDLADLPPLLAPSPF